MTGDLDSTSSIPPILEGPDPKKRRTVTLLIVAGAVVALLFGLLMLALVSWKTASLVPANSNLVLHIQSKSLNLLDGKSPVVVGPHEVVPHDGYLAVGDSEIVR